MRLGGRRAQLRPGAARDEPNTGEDTLVSLFTDDHSKSKSGVHKVALDGYDFRWFRVGGLAYILERER